MCFVSDPFSIPSEEWIKPLSSLCCRRLCATFVLSTLFPCFLDRGGITHLRRLVDVVCTPLLCFFVGLLAFSSRPRIFGGTWCHASSLCHFVCLFFLSASLSSSCIFPTAPQPCLLRHSNAFFLGISSGFLSASTILRSIPIVPSERLRRTLCRTCSPASSSPATFFHRVNSYHALASTTSN